MTMFTSVLWRGMTYIPISPPTFSLLELKCWTVVTFCISFKCLDLIAPVMRQRALFFTLSRGCNMVLALVDQVMEPYYRWHLIVPSDNVLNILSFALQVMPVVKQNIKVGHAT
eukprot:TRINITY_DN511_c0_g1_i13.p2 TRINITY_DN511_c0_g1~~TRINITY_DN511_c0_g1_i13.p2  ORF type:complete len:113 (+),score=13.65 TRINITY_DN511_c0_g1_i13:1624-1962(+)